MVLNFTSMLALIVSLDVLFSIILEYGFLKSGANSWSNEMEKRYLLAPGPTAIPPEAVLKMAEPIIHHRNPIFEGIIQEVRENLKYVFVLKEQSTHLRLLRNRCNGKCSDQHPVCR
jgi:hypothetical protein